MHIRGGYRAMTPIHVCNALAAYDEGLVRYRTLRTYFACVAVLAVREAAARGRGERPKRAGEAVHAAELARLTGTAEAIAVADLKRLAKAGLVTRERDIVRLVDDALPCAVELLELVSPSRSWSRPIPVPRPWLRFLARCPRPAVAKVLLAHGLRGLSLERGSGAVRNRGTLKATWVADVFAVSLRAVKAARATLVATGLIARDEGSSQWKLNRDGSYFELNLTWRANGSARRREPIGIDSAPPVKRLGTPSDLEDQRTARAGVPLGPDFRNVQREDLERFARMETLFWQAVDRRWLRESEMDVLNFLAAAVRARFGKARDPVRVFVAIVRRGLWTHITCAEEERARAALARHRERCPTAFRERPAALAHEWRAAA
ncbi:hypothetical protein L6V77_03350 [Myxococcota bacterium]|nr:hypothetical protein [Myxococcota bacterium]